MCLPQVPNVPLRLLSLPILPGMLPVFVAVFGHRSHLIFHQIITTTNRVFKSGISLIDIEIVVLLVVGGHLWHRFLLYAR